MVSLSSIEIDLQAAMKQRNSVAVDTLRGLKTRLENERISTGKDLDEPTVLKVIASEVKRRKEAAQAFTTGGRPEMAQKEQDEAILLAAYLPAQLSESDIVAKVDELITANSWTQKDFGQAMGKLKAEFGNSADGATISKILKEKLSA